jgi:hypothetical protein
MTGEAQLVRRVAAEVEEDEGIAASVCHLAFVEQLRGPLADRVARLVEAAVASGNLARARRLTAAYWELVDVGLAAAALEVADAELLRAASGEAPAADGPLALFGDAAAWRADAA